MQTSDSQSTLQDGVTLHRQGRLAESAKIYAELLKQNPNQFDALHLLGIIAYQTRQLERAVDYISKAISINPTYPDAHSNLGSVLQKLKRHHEALESFDKAIALKPDYAMAYINRGVALQNLERHEAALASFDKAMELEPGYAEAYCNRGVVLQELKRYEEALAFFRKAIELKPDYVEAYCNHGVALQELKRHEEALISFAQAIKLKPDGAKIYNNRGVALRELRLHEEALASFDTAIELKPDYAEAHCNRGAALLELRRYEEGLAGLDTSLSLRPDYPTAFNNRGVALRKLKRSEDALACFNQAILLKSDFAAAYANSGDILRTLGFHEEATGRYQSALELNTHYPLAKSNLLREKMMCGDWSKFRALVAGIESDISLGRLSAEPFMWHGISNSPGSLQICSQIYSNEKYPYISSSPRSFTRNHKKIRIGYLFGESHHHATSLLISGVLEQHDKSRFEIYFFENDADDKIEIRERIRASADRTFDIQRLNDRMAADLIENNEIDVLVNLNGYTGDERTGVFARRCSPIQVSYLGFPGTMGAEYIDYIIADRIVIPEQNKVFYDEKIVYMPYCYQSNDDKKEISDHMFSRRDVGLPESGFVFCCFNNPYKITPDVYDIWMRILSKVDDSVLWLIDGKSANDNLRDEAELRGVAPERIVFAPRMKLAEHLARHRLADLFLDTLPYNAHTTASDALWAGLPVLTQTGETFAGRVAASLLTAIGLPELITRTPRAYEELAIELATRPEKLASMKDKLAAVRLIAPLFDTKLFTTHIEAAYTAMYERYRAHLAPDHIYIAP